MFFVQNRKRKQRYRIEKVCNNPYLSFLKYCIRIGLQTIVITAKKMSAAPITILTVSFSSKTQTPIAIAVTGSNAPMIALYVGPMFLIATLIKRIGMTVGTKATPRVLVRQFADSSNGWSRVPKPVQTKNVRVPATRTQNVILPDGTVFSIEWSTPTIYMA